MSTHRWPCSVPGCRCTVGVDRPYAYGDWALCRKHWPMVPVKYRKALQRAAKRHILTGPNLNRRHFNAISAYNRLADRVVRYAIERALGLA